MTYFCSGLRAIAQGRHRHVPRLTAESQLRQREAPKSECGNPLHCAVSGFGVPRAARR